MKYIATIIDTVTGKTLTSEHDYPYDDEDSLRWYWTDGNWSCDCNRGADFDVVDISCGGSRFQVPFLTLENGEKIYIDLMPS